MAWMESIAKKIERERQLRMQFPEFEHASPDKVMQVDNYRLRNGGFVSDFSQMAMRLAKHAAELSEQAQSNAPDLIQGAADRERAGLPQPGVKRAGVPLGVEAAFPETAVGRKVYESGSSGPSLNITGSLLDNREGLPGPLNAALDVPVLGRALTEVARPANWMSAAIAPLSFAPRAGMGVRLGAEVVAGVTTGLVADKVTDVTDNPLLGLGAGLAAGIGAGSGVSRAGGLFGGADDTARQLRAIVTDRPRIAGATAPVIPSAVNAPAGSALQSAVQSAISSKSTIPAGVARTLDQAHSMVRADRPGAVAKTFYRIPGMSSLFRPGVNIPDNIVEAYAGSTSARAEIGQQAFASRRAMYNQFDQVFGKGSTEGAPVAARFTGTPAEAKYPGTGSLYDILQRPEKYDLNPQQQALVDAFDKRNETLRALVVEDYGADIRRFHREQGGAYVPNVDRSEAAKSIDEAIGRSASSGVSSGRAKTRLFDTGYDRWLADSDAVARGKLKPEQVFTPETNIRALVEGMDSFKETAAASEVLKAGLGGKTKLEVLQQTHPELVQRWDAARTNLVSIRARLKTAERRAGINVSKADELDSMLDEFERAQPLGGARPLARIPTAMRNLEQRAQRLAGPKGGPWPGGRPATRDESVLSAGIQSALDKLDALIPDETERIRFLDTAINRTDRRINALSGRGGLYRRAATELRNDLANAKDVYAATKQAWEAANPRGYTFVGDGIYRYFPPDQVPKVKTLLKTETHGLFRAINEINAGALSGDLSPIIGQQGQVAWLTAPLQTSKAVFGGLARGGMSGDLFRAFKADALAEDVARSPQSWQDFAFYTGRAAAPGNIPGEFGGGWVRRIPVLGEKFVAANDAVYSAVIRAQKNMWDSEVDHLVKRGVSPQNAMAIAARSVSQVIPTPNQSLAGMSRAHAGAIRAPVTSLTFIQRPAQAMSEAAEGMANLLIPGRSVSEQQRLAIKNIVKLHATVAALSASTGALYAVKNGQDPVQAAVDAVNPNDKHFMSITLPDGSRIPLGGPYRAAFQAIAPAPVKTGDGEEVWVPFAGTYRFIKNRVSPILGTQVDLIRNEDFYGNKIVTGDFPTNILQILEYEAEGMLPLTAGTPIEAVRTQGLDALRTGSGLMETATRTAASFVGTNVGFPTVTDRLSEAGNKMFDGEDKDFYDRTRQEQAAVLEANPELQQRRSEERIEKDDTKGKLEEMRVTFREEQENDDARVQSGEIDWDTWKDNRARRVDMIRGASDIAYGGDGRIAKPKDAYEEWLNVIKDNEGPDGVDWDAVDGWVAQQDDKRQQFITDNSGLYGTKLEKERSAAGEKLEAAGYFDLGDKVWSKIGKAAKSEAKDARAYEAELRQKVRANLEKRGLTPQQVEILTNRAIENHGLLSRYKEIRNDLEQAWIVKNRKLVAEAYRVGYFHGSLRDIEEAAIVSASKP